MLTEYDEVPYTGRVHHQTHVEAIATVAQIFGLEIPNIHRCRVLELGCGDGSNLLSMAYNMPDAFFYGVDFSQTHINRGRNMISNGKLSNIQLEAGNIDTFVFPNEPFDFIICHGVFSWVSDHTRERILDICKNKMSKLGIAYISYNTLPGWRMHSIIRDMMRYHSSRMDMTNDKIDQGRAMVQFAAEHVVGGDLSIYGQFIREQVDFISRIPGEYLYHEYLEPENTAFYFHEFIDLLQKHQLQYLGETDISTMVDLHYPEETRAVLNDIAPNIYHLEQYMDFLRNRRFRCSLIVNHEREFNREITPEPFQKLFIAFHAFPKGSPSPDEVKTTESGNLEESLKQLTYQTEDAEDSQLISDSPLYNTALSYLHQQWPRAVHYDDLVCECEKRLNTELSKSERLNLATLIQTLLIGQQLDVHSFQAQLASEISSHPAVSPMARFQASHQHLVCSQRHDMVSVNDPWVRMLIELLDGTRTQNELTEALLEAHIAGKLPELVFIDSDLPEEEQEVDVTLIPRSEVVERLGIRVHEILKSLLENGVLVS
ncbi:MAG: methyltransferase regulatory domain-containing protein [Myxococcota bacterium]